MHCDALKLTDSSRRQRRNSHRRRRRSAETTPPNAQSTRRLYQECAQAAASVGQAVQSRVKGATPFATNVKECRAKKGVAAASILRVDRGRSESMSRLFVVSASCRKHSIVDC